MFNWIQIYLTKHYKWFLIILLGVIIIPFVFTIGNFSPWGGSGPGYKEQPFFQYDLSLAKDQQTIFGNGQISMSMNIPSFYGNPGEAYMQSYSLSRAAYLHLADTLGLPGPGKEAFKEHVHSLAGFMNFSTQEFDQAQWTTFVASLSATGLTEAFVTTVIEEDYRVNKVRELLGGPGHILDFEAIHAAQRQNTEWTVETAKLSYDDFEPEIQLSQEDIQSYFDTNAFRYEVAAKAKVSYIFFDPRKNVDANYQPEPGEKSIHFFTNKARYQAAIPKPEPVEKEDGTTETPETPEVTLEEVEAQVVDEIRLERATKETQKNAEEFAYLLFDKEITNGSSEFEAALASTGVSLKPLVPYSESAVTSQDGLTSQTLSQVFRLNESRYFSDPIANGEDFVILIYQGEEPAYQPEIGEVQLKVKEDLKEERKREQFIDKGSILREAVQSAMANGESFADAAKEQNLTHKAFESFKQSDQQQPEGLEASLINQLPNLSAGDTSEWIATATDGTLLYVATKTVPTFDSEAEEVKTFLESNARMLSVSNVEPIVSDLLTTELANTAFAQDQSTL